MLAFYILSKEVADVATYTPLPLIWTIYVLSVTIFVLAIGLAIKTVNLRKRVEDKYKTNANMLKQWERGLRLVKSYEDEEVINGLDMLHALNEAQNKFWDRHVFEVLMEHKNQRIAAKAKFIYEKLASSTETDAPTANRS